MAEGLQITECEGFRLATIMLRKSADPQAIGKALQLIVPTGPTCVAGNGLTLIGTGPGVWLAFAESSSPRWAEELAEKLPGASISDQSGGYVIFKLAGAKARKLLQRGAYIDLDPSAFGVGSVAATVIAHIGTTVWQIDDAPTFHVAVFRSFAWSFRDWIRTTSAQLDF